MGEREGQKTTQRPFSSFRLVGLGFWQAWWMLTLCSPSILPFNYAAVFPVDPLFLVLGFTTMGYLVVVVMSRWISPFITRPVFLVTTMVCSFVGTLAMGALSSGILGAVLVAPYIIATILFSLSNAWLLIMWGERWSTLATGRVGRFLYVSYAFAFVLFFLLQVLPEPFVICAIALLPVASTLVLMHTEDEPRRETSVIPFSLQPVTFVRIMIYLVIMSIAYGTSQAAMVLLPAAEGSVTLMFLFAGVCIAALALYLFFSQPPVEAFTLYRPVLPALSIGLLLIAMLPSNLIFIGGGLSILAVYSLDMLIMLVATDCSFRLRTPVALTLGFSIFMARVGTLFGSIGFRQLYALENAGSVLIIHLLVGCAIAVILMGSFVFSMDDLQKMYEPLPAQRKTEPLKEKCERLSSLCGLTARESEVFLLLAAGRSVPYICKELTIAKGTAKHHVSSIYRKLGVYDRQSLHDVIEQGMAGKGAL